MVKMTTTFFVTKEAKNMKGFLGRKFHTARERCYEQIALKGAVVGGRHKACYSYALMLLGMKMSEQEIKKWILEFASNCKDANGNSAPLNRMEALKCLASAKNKMGRCR
jgi:hypothetical protein